MCKGKSDERIAVIGMAVNVPGANNKNVFWHNLCAGIDSTGSFPKAREQELQPYLDKLGLETCAYKTGGYINDISSFDYNYFKIPKIEAILMTPAQRLFMENAVTAMEDAGYGGDKWYGSNIGVYVGYIGTMEVTDYQHITGKMNMGVSPTGIFSSGIAGRLSYFMNFSGESLVLDSACSSTFAALKYACNALSNYECEGAVVGGVQINIYPNMEEFTIGIESPDGHTKPFDVSADGTGVSEGVCTVILKRLSDAIRDKDHIYGIVRTVMSNQDGRSLGLAAPNPRAQTNLMHKVIEHAGLLPEDISYMELHGTGTKLGDSIEMKALDAAFDQLNFPSEMRVPIGSLKANIGHTFACAGLTGLIKCCMMMEYKKICPQINYSAPSYADKKSRFQIHQTLSDFADNNKALNCIISNYGLSGTNYICAVSEYSVNKCSSDVNSKELFVLSAMSKSSLSEGIEEYISYLEKNKKVDLTELCYTASAGRGHHEHRLAILCESAEELLIHLKEFRFCSVPESYTYYSYAKKLTDPRQKITFGEIDEASFVNMNKEAQKLLESVWDSESVDIILKQMASYYISGASINWQNLYHGKDVHRISLPTYSFDKIKCWPE